MSLLNLNSGGEYTPHIRYLASVSSWTMSSDNGMIPFQFTQAIIDLENIKTGWCVIAEGQAPEWVMDESLTTPAFKPQDGREWKRGFKVDVYSAQLFAPQPKREFGTSGTGAVMGIDALYTEYAAQKDANPGKVPVVEFKGGVPTKIGKGNTSVPQLSIVKFVDRPAELQPSAPQVTPVVHSKPQAAASSVSEF